MVEQRTAVRHATDAVHSAGARAERIPRVWRRGGTGRRGVFQVSTSKTKSARRFEDLNIIVDKMLRKLPSRHGLALLVFFRHADVKRRFRVSSKDLAKTLGVHPRTARKLFDDLEEWKVIGLLEPQRGTIPRVFQITGKIARGASASHTRDLQ